VVSFVAAFVDCPRGELGRIGDFLQRQKIAQTLEDWWGAKAFHALENDD
jgi:hypothetical protein